jgi:preprotein translocase subunit SecF
VVVLYKELDINAPWVQSAGATDIVVRSKPISEAIKTNVINQMENRFGGPVTVVRFDTIGPSMGEEVVIQTLYAIGLTMLGVMVYIIYAFREVPHAFHYGLTAIISIMHDVAVVVGIEAIFGHFLGWEVDLLFPITLLIIISFSAYDSIVIFDRIRENLRVHRRLDYETLVNHSIVQTLDRSIITRLTVMLAILAILLFGGVTTRQFAIILLIGLFSGTYSSIFIASPILVLWENREWRWWFSRKKASTG